MTGRAFLHLGMHKTGTTTLQTIFDGYDDGTRRYLRLGDTPNHSNALALLYGSLPQTHPRAVAPPETLAKLRAVLRAEWRTELERANADGRDLIVSGEGLSTQIPAAGITALLAEIRAEGLSPVGCAYIRDPVAFSASVMSQLVKSGTFIFDPAALWPRYRARFEPWRAAFGAGQLRLVPYRRADLLEDFADWTGMDPARAATRGRARNVSPSAEALAIVAMAWHHGDALRRTGLRRGAQLLRPLHGFGQGVALPDAEAMAKAAADHAAQTAWMEEAMGVPMPKETLPDGPIHHISTLDDLAVIARRSLRGAEAHIRRHANAGSGSLGHRLRAMRARTLALRAVRVLETLL